MILNKNLKENMAPNELKLINQFLQMRINSILSIERRHSLGFLVTFHVCGFFYQLKKLLLLIRENEKTILIFIIGLVDSKRK